MKISVNLLNSYLKNQLSTEKMAEVIEQTEVEVEEILYANKLDEKIIVAKVLEVKKHPNADKLNKAKVDNGTAIIDIVCGAPNIREGLVVALAQVGSILPDGFEIGEAKIRGEISHGMLCSEKELSWGDDHSGIVELDPSLPLGKSLCDILKMTDIVDIKTPTNRWDYLSYVGLGREIAATDLDNQLIEPDMEEIQLKNDKDAKIEVEEDICGAFYSVKARMKENIKSPQWLVDNLQASGVRTINAVVDITNFVMLEYGQPSHAYDINKIKGHSLGIRYAKKDELLVTLDGKKLKLSKADLVIVDKSGAIGLAGVMGGISTETDDETTNVLIEIANFDKTTVRRSALRHGIRTEASARFEKGLPLSLPYLATKRIIKLLKEICDAEIIKVNEQLHSPVHHINLGMRLRKAEKFIGYKLDEKEVMNALFKRGFKPKHFSFSKEIKEHLGKPYMYGAQIATEKLEKFDCSLLTQYIYNRAGVDIGCTAQMQSEKGMEVPEIGFKPGDLLFLKGDEKESGKKIGHVGMFIGSGKVLQASSTEKKVVISPVTKFTKAKNYVGAKRYVENFNHIISVEVPWWRNDISMEADLFEEVAKTQGYNNMPDTLPIMPPTDTSKHQTLPSLMNLRERLVGLGLIEVMTYSFISREDIEFTNQDISKNLKIENPLSSEQDYLRTTLLPSHLRAAANNQSVSRDSMFEISRVYEKGGKAANEKWSLGFTVWGEDSLLRVKGLLDAVFGWYSTELDVEREGSSNIYVSGRAAKVIEEQKLGDFGQIKPAILKKYGFKQELSFAEINIQALIDSNREIMALPPLPYQVVYKDMTVELQDVVMYGDLKKSIQDLVYSVSFVDEYKNEELEKNAKKRVTIRAGFDLGPNPKTEEISLVLEKCEQALQKSQKAKVL
jgi:phenylalanyl-tRNA synthetase beta subunit